MSTSIKSPDGLKDAECKKGQLSHWPPIPYVPVVDIVMPKEDPQIFKIKLPDTSHLSMPINSRGNNEEYLTHIVIACCKNKNTTKARWYNAKGLTSYQELKIS